MKKTLVNCILLLSLIILGASCKKGTNYPGGIITEYIPLYDLRNIYTGSDVVLTEKNMFGSNSISGMVISDHSGKNMPEGLLIVQDKKRLGLTQGIAIALGADASKYVSGDSITVKIEGATLTRKNGMLQLLNVASTAVDVKGSGLPIAKNRVNSSAILANPGKYESTLVIIVKAGFDPMPQPTEVLSGDKIINDGFDDITLHTEPKATFANDNLKFSANYSGVVINKQGSNNILIPEVRLRTANDIVVLSAVAEIPEIIITGLMEDPKGTNANNQYIQFLATKDINFATTKFSVVVNNNAGTATPIGPPNKGWATGDKRSYKLNLTSGSVKKGDYFYVGGITRRINSGSSTQFPAAKLIAGRDYSLTTAAGAGDDFGVGGFTFLAQSGNAYGIGVFKGTTVTSDSRPIDCIWISSGGTLFSLTPTPTGYRVANNDFYDAIDPIDLTPQPFYRQGTNTLFHPYHPDNVAIPDQGYYYKFGGIYSVTLGKWKKARAVKFFILDKLAPMSTIEDDNIVITTSNSGKETRDTIPVTKIQ